MTALRTPAASPDLARVMGVGRAGLFAGVVTVTLATMANAQAVAWGGVALTALALVVNGSGKIARYGRLDVPATHRVLIVGSWLVLVATLFALVVDYTYTQFHAGYDGFFWPLGIGVVGFAMVYQGVRSKFVPDATPGE